MDPKLFGLDKVQIDIEAVCRALGVEDIHVVRALTLKKLREATEKAMAYKGVSVIISKQICPLLAKRVGVAKKGRGFEVDADTCTNCRDCINEIACPAFYLDDDKPAINLDMCESCGVCSQICNERAIRPAKNGVGHG